MTLTFATDGDGDLVLGQDDRVIMLTGAKAVANVCKNVALGQLGEMMYATDRGLPNFDLVWIGAPNVSQWQAKLRSSLLAVDGVTGISSLIVKRVGHEMQYAAVIKTVYGEVQIDG